MFPELFKIPFTHLTIYSYGLMLVIAFLAAISLIRRLSRDFTPDPKMITNAALYALIAGVGGARAFYVLHYWDRFKDNLASVFSIWDGGLEQLGGLLALVVIYLYIRFHKLPVRKYFDIIAIALMLALAIGRIGCFLSGCCFGKPADLQWAVRFPYASDAYYSQIYPDLKRNRPQPYVNLPADFFGFTD
jgi:phosphatidylglycerol:prolipoprotein diacylglycerol transferase